MSHETIMTDLMSDFNTKWAGFTPVEWPNTPFLAGSEEEYVRFGIIFFDTENAVVGTARQKYSGNVIITAFAEINKGSAQAFSLAQKAIDFMQNLSLNAIFTYAGTTVVVGPDPENSNLYVVNAKIPFESVN